MNPCPIELFPFWNQLTAQEKRLLCDNVQTTIYRQGQIVASSMTECMGLILLRSGVLRLGLLSEDGRQVTISRVLAGEICVFSASCVLSSITFDVGIDAETDCEAYVIPASITAKLIHSNVYVENFVYKKAAERFSEILIAVERILFNTLEQRLAAYLLEESARQHTDKLKVTHEQLAQNIGSAREAVTRTARQLAQKQCVELKRGSVTILDHEKLKEICCG